MNPDLPPPNRALGWYRFMLWTMPTCIAITTAFGIGWLLNYQLGWTGNATFWLWLVVNLAATYGIGLFESRLHRPPSRKTPDSAASFLLLQLVIVPSLTCALLFAICLAGAY